MRRRPLVALLVAALLRCGAHARRPQPTVVGKRPSQPPSRPTDRRGDPRLHRKLYVEQAVAGRPSPPTRDHRFEPIGLQPMAQWRERDLVPGPDRQEAGPRLRPEGQPGAPDPGGRDLRDPGPRLRRLLRRRLRPTRLQEVGQPGSRPGCGGRHAMAILEPDALGHLGRLRRAGQPHRPAEVRDQEAERRPGSGSTSTPLTRGWVKPHTMAKRLIRVGRPPGPRLQRQRGQLRAHRHRAPLRQEGPQGPAQARGREEALRHGHLAQRRRSDQRRQLVQPDGTRGSAAAPEVVAGRKLDAYLWVKAPGESDGTCNGGPYAGAWWPDYALRLMGLL